MILDIHTHRKYGNALESVRNIAATQLDQEGEGLFSVGIHPWDAKLETLEADWDKVVEAANDDRVVALGETGLDKCCEVPLDLQTEVFRRHILLAEHLHKPLIIHCVRAFNELVLLRKEFKPLVAWIVHGFRGKPELAADLVRHDFFLSFGERYSQAAFCSVPVERIFLETDESEADIYDLYERAAKLKQMSVDELVSAIQAHSPFINRP